MALGQQIYPLLLVDSDEYSATIEEMYRAVYVCIYNIHTTNGFELHLRHCFYKRAEALSNKSRFLLYFLNSVNWEDDNIDFDGDSFIGYRSWKYLAEKLSGKTADTKVEEEFDLLDILTFNEDVEPLRDYDKEETERDLINEYFGESLAIAESEESGWYYSDNDITHDCDSYEHSNYSADYGTSNSSQNDINNSTAYGCGDEVANNNRDEVLSTRRESADELLRQAEELEFEADELRRQANALLEMNYPVTPLAINPLPAERQSGIDEHDIPF